MKKLMSIVLSAAIICIASFCVFPSYADTMQTKDIAKTQLGSSNTYYSFDADTKTLTISGEGATPNNFTNSSSSQPWYSWRANGSIERVVVEEGITSIGQYVLYCVCASEIILPDTLKTLYGNSLAGNSKIKEITLPDSLVTISNSAFSHCTALEKIVIPDSVKTIGNSAFENCSALKSVVFENMRASVAIRTKAFFKCDSLKEISIPYNVSLMTYSFGYGTADSSSKETKYEDFVIKAYRDSKGYTYALNYGFQCEPIGIMEIFEGEEIQRSYEKEYLSETMTFAFTPKNTSRFIFYSAGDIDVSCVLTDSNGKVLAESDDNSPLDLNFTINEVLKENETHYFTVSSNNAVGNYTVSLMPVGMDDIYIDWNFSYDAVSLADGTLDVVKLIDGLYVNFVYDSGYVYEKPFKEGESYAGMKLHYLNKLNGRVTCGDNIDTILVGDTACNFNIRVEHSYTTKVIEPTITNGGYTQHICVLCGMIYTSDYTDFLGTDVYGYVKIMGSPDGDVLDKPLAGINIYNTTDNFIGETDENGFFFIEYAYDYIVLESGYGPPRKVKITHGKNDLGEIGLVYCDFFTDNYINVKDFAILKFSSDAYDEDDVYAKNMDINNDGVIDFADWEYARSYLTYGKLTESIYNY
ncbi:MAG: leucine-rich repeat domain-containing protein [Clostridium sp.]|nr:leucine-rich repeat domain-containing protein [Clostridium sp.]